MASEPIDPFKAYRGIRHGEEGKHLERLFRALCFILDRWCSFGTPCESAEGKPNPPRPGRYGDPDSGNMNMLEFDKLINVVCRVWGEMFRIEGQPELDQIAKSGPEEMKTIVRFRPPTLEIPGTHGPGQARPRRDNGDDDRWIYVTYMLEMLAEEEILYFVFEPERGDKISRKQESRSRTGTDNEDSERSKFGEPHKWFVRPGLAVADDDQFWDGFTQREISFLRSLAQALKHLGPMEIRALGVHKNKDGTVEETRRELRWASSVSGDIRSRLSSGHVDTNAAIKLQVRADEAFRKASSNQIDYKNAYNKMRDELSEDAELRKAFEESHGDPKSVWSDPRLVDLVAEARRWQAVANYTYAIGFFENNPTERESQHSRKAKYAAHCFDEGNPVAREFKLPQSIEGAFDATSGAVRADVAAKLSQALERLEAPR